MKTSEITPNGNRRMYTWLWILDIALFCAAVAAEQLVLPNVTSCEEFERGARFSPYDAIDSTWRVFYFWADNVNLYPVIFALPAKNRVSKFKETVEVIDPHLGREVEWFRASLFMNPEPGTEILFLHAGTPGAYRAVIKVDQRTEVRPHPIPHIKFADVRIKSVGAYIGMMCCEDFTAYAFARIDNVPATELECIEAASTLGYRGENGRSHLYLKSRFQDEL